LSALNNLAITPPPALFRKRGQAYDILGEFERARADYETSQLIARSKGDRQAEWEALLKLGMLWTGRDYERSGEYYQHAYEQARMMNDPFTLAHSLNRLGNWHLNSEQPLEALKQHQDALVIFQELQDQRGIAETLDLLGMTSYLGGDLLQGTIYYKQAIELFRELDDRHGLTSSLATLTLRGPTYQTDTMVSATASLVDVIPDGEQALKIAQDIGQRSAEAYACIFLGCCLGAKGDYTLAIEFAQSGLTIAEEIEHQQWMTAAHCVLGVTYRDLLELPMARQHLEQALSLANETYSLHWIRTATGHLTSTYVLQKELARAEALINASIDSNTPFQTLGQRLVWSASAELALAQGNPTHALELSDKLMASAANFSDNRNIPRPSKLRGEAYMILGNTTEAEAVLLAAKEGAYSQGMRSFLWRIYVTLGKLYQTLGRHAETESAFANSHAIIEELAITISDDYLQEHFHREATSMLPRTRALSSGRAAKQASEGLTAPLMGHSTLVILSRGEASLRPTS
jgi:tetratricopeptide (TPR) repeat protein